MTRPGYTCRVLGLRAKSQSRGIRALIHWADYWLPGTAGVIAPVLCGASAAATGLGDGSGGFAFAVCAVLEPVAPPAAAPVAAAPVPGVALAPASAGAAATAGAGGYSEHLAWNSAFALLSSSAFAKSVA